MNWFLYIVNEDFLDEDGELIKSGEAGVGQCSMSPGIMDAPYGTMYIISGFNVKKYFKENNIRNLNAYHVRRAIENYYFKTKQKKIDKSDEFIFD